MISKKIMLRDSIPFGILIIFESYC